MLMEEVRKIGRKNRRCLPAECQLAPTCFPSLECLISPIATPGYEFIITVPGEVIVTRYRGLLLSCYPNARNCSTVVITSHVFSPRKFADDKAFAGCRRYCDRCGTRYDHQTSDANESKDSPRRRRPLSSRLSFVGLCEQTALRQTWVPVPAFVENASWKVRRRVTPVIGSERLGRIISLHERHGRRKENSSRSGKGDRSCRLSPETLFAGRNISKPESKGRSLSKGSYSVKRLSVAICRQKRKKQLHPGTSYKKQYSRAVGDSAFKHG